MLIGARLHSEYETTSDRSCAYVLSLHVNFGLRFMDSIYKQLHSFMVVSVEMAVLLVAYHSSLKIHNFLSKKYKFIQPRELILQGRRNDGCKGCQPVRTVFGLKPFSVTNGFWFQTAFSVSFSNAMYYILSI